MRATTRVICLGTVFVAAGTWGLGARAQAGSPPAAVAGLADWTAPVSQQTLAETRGGFDVGNGLMASFGIDRAVYVNGDLVASTSFNIPDIARMTQAQAAVMATALNAMSLTQVGPNNTFDPSALGQTSAGTVIQNTLDNQNIQSITTLNTSVNSLNAFRDANFQSALQQAQLQSLGH